MPELAKLSFRYLLTVLYVVTVHKRRLWYVRRVHNVQGVCLLHLERNVGTFLNNHLAIMCGNCAAISWLLDELSSLHPSPLECPQNHTCATITIIRLLYPQPSSHKLCSVSMLTQSNQRMIGTRYWENLRTHKGRVYPVPEITASPKLPGCSDEVPHISTNNLEVAPPARKYTVAN